MMKYKFGEISVGEYEVWFESNYENLTGRSPFHHPAWLQAASKGVNFRIFIAGIYQGSDLVGMMPGFLTQRGPFRLFGSPLPGTMTSYLGPVGIGGINLADEIPALLPQINGFIRKHLNAVYFRTTLRDAPGNYPFNLPAAWVQERPRSYRLDLLPGEDELWLGVKSDCRRNIKKAKREGIEIHPLEDAKLFFNILEETFRRHGTTSWHKESFFQILLSELTPLNLLWSWGARYQGETIAAGLFFHDESEMHFLSGASSPNYGNLPTSYLLHWHAITTACHAGLKIFNSEASLVPSVDKFKESFRPNLERRHSLIWAQKYASLAQKVYKYSSSSWRGLKSKLERGTRINAPSS